MIDAATPGATVRVPAGVYREHVRIDKPIVLLGEPGAIIDGCGSGDIVEIAAPDVTLRGFTVRNTGIDLDHPDLQANLVTGKSFVSGTSSADDDAGHGTHVAGIIAALNNNGGVIGVAPAASLMPVKVLNSAGSGWLPVACTPSAAHCAVSWRTLSSARV